MTECAVCGAEIPAGGKLCSFCGSHFLADELLSDPGFEQIRSALGKALEWLYWRRNSCQVHNLIDAEKIILAHSDFVEENMQSEAVKALCYSDPRLRTPRCVADPWGAVALHPVEKAVGMSSDATRIYVKELESRHVVRIEPCASGRTMDDAKPFSTGQVCWVECEPEQPASE